MPAFVGSNTVVKEFFSFILYIRVSICPNGQFVGLCMHKFESGNNKFFSFILYIRVSICPNGKFVGLCMHKFESGCDAESC